MNDLNIIFGEPEETTVTVEAVSRKGKTLLPAAVIIMRKSYVPDFTTYIATKGIKWRSMTASCYAALYPNKVSTLGSDCDTTQGRGAN